MPKIAWGWLAAGVVLGATVATGVLLFVTVGPSVGESDDDPETAAAPRGAAGTAAGDRGVGESGAGGAQAGGAQSEDEASSPSSPSSPRLVTWLSERLQEAYRQEALPEIIGDEAGSEAADQVFDYVTDVDDTDTVHDLIDDVFERTPADLGLDGWEVASTIDCEPAPCVLRVDLGPPGGDESLCGGAAKRVVAELTTALQPGRLTNVSGGCSFTAAALSAAAAEREDEINAGIEGFINNYFSEAKDRAGQL